MYLIYNGTFPVALQGFQFLLKKQPYYYVITYNIFHLLIKC